MSGDATSERIRRRRLAATFFAAGALALTVQVTLLRELLVDLGGDESAVGLGLAAWLAGIAAGAAASRALCRRRAESWAGAGFALLALSGPLELVAGRLGRWLLAPPPGELLALGRSVCLALAVLAPAGALVGATFTALAVVAPRAGWTAGPALTRLYVLESFGSLAGGLVLTFLVVPWLAPFAGVALASGAWALLGSAAARARILPGRRVLPGVALVLIALGLPAVSTRIEEATLRVRFRGLAPGIPLLAWADTPYQHVAVGGDALRHLYASGQYAGSFPDPSEDEARAHRLACLAPRPGPALLVGSGVEGLLRHLLAHPVERIDVVELDRRALGLLREWMPPEDDRALDASRVRIVADDPRRFLAHGHERYGLILILEPPPVTLRLARLCTVEFYRLCAARLAPDGVLVVGLETAPNVLTGRTAAVGGSLWSALRRVFPVVRAGPGPAGLLLAGSDPRAATLDPAVLALRFASRGIVSDVFVPELFALDFPPERVAAQQAALEQAAALHPPSTDERPVSFLLALALRQQAAGSAGAALLGLVARASWRSLAAAALLPSLLVLLGLGLSRDRDRSLALAATHAIATTGACGMAWSLLVLFSYQTRAGALYGRLGLLAAVFMLGLALGGWALARSAELAEPRAQRRLAGTLAAAVVFALLVPGALLALGSPLLDLPGLAELLHGMLLLVAGATTGASFPVAAGVLFAARRDLRETAGGLEAADHAGAAVAALAGGVLLIPALGLAGCAWLLAALEGAALCGVLLAARVRARGRPRRGPWPGRESPGTPRAAD